MLSDMRFSAILATLLIACNAQATPSGAADEMDQLFANKGFLPRIEQVRQSISQKATELVVTAKGFLGAPYRAGGESGETGFDCSGCVRAIYGQTIGLILPRKAEQQAAATEKIERTELQPGDLVFFNTMRRAFSHVGIYVGEGKFIHSPKPGGEVRVEDMAVTYWNQRFNGARRVNGPGQMTTTVTPVKPVTQLSYISIAPLP